MVVECQLVSWNPRLRLGDRAEDLVLGSLGFVNCISGNAAIYIRRPSSKYVVTCWISSSGRGLVAMNMFSLVGDIREDGGGGESEEENILGLAIVLEFDYPCSKSNLEDRCIAP